MDTFIKPDFSIAPPWQGFVFPRALHVGRVSVIIPTGNDAPGLMITLGTLQAQIGRDPEVEVFVVNDGGHEAVTAACRNFAWVREIRLVPNSGAYVARNIALRESTGEILAFLDANVKAAPDWLEKVRTQMESADYAAGPILFPAVEKPDIVELTEILRGFAVESDFGNRGGFTANLAVRREVFSKLGGFEESLKSFGDFEFGTRVQGSGLFRCIFCREMIVIHPFRKLGENLRKQRRMAHGRLRLGATFPDRFPDYKRTYSSFFRAALPPRRLNLIGSCAPSLSPWQWVGCYGVACLTRLVFAWWLLVTNPESPGYIDPPQKFSPEDIRS